MKIQRDISYFFGSAERTWPLSVMPEGEKLFFFGGGGSGNGGHYLPTPGLNRVN